SRIQGHGAERRKARQFGAAVEIGAEAEKRNHSCRKADELRGPMRSLAAGQQKRDTDTDKAESAGGRHAAASQPGAGVEVPYKEFIDAGVPAENIFREGGEADATGRGSREPADPFQ